MQFWIAGLLVATFPGAVAPGKSQAPPLRVDAQEIQEYARALDFTISQVAGHFQALQSDGSMRHCTCQELVAAAVAGLYEAAGVPMPASTAAAVRRARTGDELLLLIIHARRELGRRQTLIGSKAFLASVSGICKVLDRYAAVVSAEEMVRDVHHESGYGVGMELERGAAGTFRVKTVVPGSPAQRAGLRPGDVITQINHREASAIPTFYSLNPVSDAVPIVPAGINGSDFELSFTRTKCSETRNARLRAQSFVAETVFGERRDGNGSWIYWSDESSKIAHVRLGRLVAASQDASAGGTSEELVEVLKRLQDDGMRGLVLDLRWCPGGARNESIEIARIFLSAACPIVTVRDDKVQTAVAGAGADRFLDVPMMVLVNGETCGGGELIAAALQDNRRAAVAGQRTLGKSSIQLAEPLPGGAAYLKLTNGCFMRPSKKNLQRFPESTDRDDWGVRPDHGLDFRVSAELSRQLQERWSWQTLRPGGCSEALPLDDPGADPQLQACLRALKGRIKDAN